MEQPSRFQILSLDGGGIRGVFTAAVLAAIEEDCDCAVVDHFDLIAGTSTGGIIAIALGLGIRPREVVNFYLQHGTKIFNPTVGISWIRQWFKAKYNATTLQESLQGILGGALFGNSTKRLVIPSYNLGDDDVYLFRTPHVADLRRDYKVPAWKVAMATSAAPTYFPAFTGVDGIRLVDGGVWANNPSMVAVAEAIGCLGIDPHGIGLLSVGTLAEATAFPIALDRGGKKDWAEAAPDVILRGTSTGVSNQVRFLLGEDRYLRLDAKVPDKDLALDNTSSVDTLIARARVFSRKEMPAIAKRFLGHTAPPYSPHHIAPGLEPT